MGGEDKWAARYARSQRAIERAAVASDREWGGREIGASSRIVASSSGDRYRIRRVAPGDSVDHEVAAGIVGFLSMLVTRGVPLVESSNARWVVVVDLLRGPFRRDRRTRKWVVADGPSGKRLQAELASFISAGGDVEQFATWPEWVPKA
jgi:hypothetical protein